jgi:large subunit ribosomal protein L17
MLSLIQYGQIKTTLAKARAVQGAFEKMLTKAKVGTVQNRRLIDETLNQREAVNRLVDVIAPTCKRHGGDTRIVKLGNRRGDDAAMVRLEIIDWKPEVAAAPVKKVTKKAADKKKATEDAKQTGVTPSTKVEDKPMNKIKRPVGASTQVKHIPQKRIAGGGK